MKVVFINMSMDGHHKEYIKALIEINGVEPYIIQSEYCNEIDCEQIVINDVVFGSNRLKDHLKWIRKVRKICEDLKPDVVHFVWGDSFYRFFGIGFGWVKRYISIVTFHQVRKSKLHYLSIKRYGKVFDHVVVHTDRLYIELRQIIDNIRHIEYPSFRKSSTVGKEEAKRSLGIETNNPILLSLGGTRPEKGLDLLLKALQYVKKPFFLLVAGAEQGINRNEIEELITNYQVKTKLILRYLSYQEIEYCLSAADYIVLPYRFSFEGASGPLAEGVSYGKCIIGSYHGSLGDIISSNHLGYTFITENIESLSSTIDEALAGNFKYDDIAIRYKKMLQVENFQKAYLTLYE